MKALLTALFFFLPFHAWAECRHALILALDVSASVTWKEYRMQQAGLAAALRDPEVVELILSDNEAPIAITVFEWGGDRDQEMSVPWTLLDSLASIDQVAEQIQAHSSQRDTIRTAIGQALEFSKQQFEIGPDCLRRTIDVSTDGKNNVDPDPSVVYASGDFAEIIVNTLSIGESTDIANALEKNEALFVYHQTYINHGFGAFTIAAEGFEDYQAAMKRKLIRELSPLAVGWRKMRDYALR